MEQTEIELEEFIPNGNSRSTYEPVEREHAANGNGEARDATETDTLIHMGTTGSNGTAATCNPADEDQTDTGNTDTPQTRNSLCRVKTELNEIIFWKVRLWMIIIFILLLILAVIMISLLVCSAIHEDTDENFDPSLFIVPLHFDGSFKLSNLVYKEELLTHSSNESQALAANFKEKLTDLYRNSPALGRYFSEAEIHAFRNGSVIADFHLKFLMPKEKEEQDQLRNYTLSREMVYNVFRQFLYDQELEKTDPMYIDPVSLNVFLG